MIRLLAVAAVLALGVPLVGPAQASTGAHRAAGHQKFLLISTNPNSEDGGPIAATGPIHAKGVDKVVSDTKDKFVFPAGTLVIKHKPAKGSQHDSFDPTTCLFTFTERGSWKVTKGTGAYSNAEGSGTYKVRGEGFGCDQNQPPNPFYVRIEANGKVSP